MIVQRATFSKSLNLRNIDKNVSDIRFPFESGFWISVSGCKLTILADIQPDSDHLVHIILHALSLLVIVAYNVSL